MKKKRVVCLIVLLFSIALLCGGGICYWGYKQIRANVSMEPARVEAIAREIMTYNMPDGSGLYGVTLGFKVAVITDNNAAIEA